ncbi:MAG: uroporphyrinogen-III C-methyltransferase [Solirubrobacteraceae bacterium MAG38_C4-C5]|nr:uroporphyrinogen-III C-methyltransferase [Candidatus Siliceabacter maunaloa]
MSARPGTVYLVGAGPGDPRLLTVRARALLASADVVLSDRLVPDGVLDGLPGEVVDVGKIGGGDQVPQEETQRLLLEHARAGRSVVRLKGGDPFVFGRGGEEAQLCAREGIPFEVVPGVTAGVAASAYAGIPVTQRGVASAVAFVTGHTQPASPAGTGTQPASPAGTGEDPGKEETAIDWPALAVFPGTLVFYMGVRRLDRIAEQLVAGGRAADEPAAIVQRGTFGDQRVVTAPLAELPVRAAQAAISAPAITIVGPVAALHEELAWFTAGPLAGRSVAVTRARAQASGLAARLRALGATVTEAPAIRVKPLEVELPDPRDYDLLVLTSPNGVHRLFDLVRDARALAGPRIAVLGPGTARALRQHGVEADVVPSRAVGEGLVDALADVPVRRALIARAQEARDVVPDALRARGAHVDDVALYRTVAEPLDPDARDAALDADYATFTSASSVRFFLEAAGGPEALRDGPRLASIGPITSAALRDHHLEPHVEATAHTPEGLVAALVADAGG